MKIRIATKDDVPAMAELLRQLFALEIDFTADYATQKQGLDLLLDRPNTAIFVAERKEQVIGMCTVQIHVSTAKGREVGVVEDVVVDIAHRGKGVGSALLRALEDWAAERGLARLQLLADRDNHPALGFYRRQGWHLTNLIGWMKHL
ncbi:N-acetyltransferase family protein [Pontiella sp.]|uniref:GNAT family N-acetyltransferase n=1 Tax=Pontiella sp. TaxID=2837462 RepID=UPI0035625610